MGTHTRTKGLSDRPESEGIMSLMTRLRGWVVGIVVTAIALHALPAEAAFDFDHGNAPIEVVIPTVIPVIFQSVNSPGDASLILRYTTVITNAWFDAIAPYHSTAVGVYSRLGRRPPPERTDRNRNVAILHAS